MLGTPNNDKTATYTWQCLDAYTLPHDLLSNLHYSVIQVPRSDKVTLQCLVLQYKNTQQKQQPLCNFIHGGPHACFTSIFMLRPLFVAVCMQACVIMVNYRGSIGYGQDFVAALPGKVGFMDVYVSLINHTCFSEDVHAATMHMLQASPVKEQLDGNRVACFGGSHGGFLSAHLVYNIFVFV